MENQTDPQNGDQSAITPQDQTMPAAQEENTQPAEQAPVQPVVATETPAPAVVEEQPAPATAPEMAAPQPVSEEPPKTADEQADEAKDKMLTFFSYLSILFLIPMFARPNSKFCQYHAKQGMTLFVVWMVIHLFGWMTSAIHIAITRVIYSLNGLVLFAFIAIGMIHVARMEMKPLPGLGILPDMLFKKKAAKAAATPTPAAPAQPAAPEQQPPAAPQQ